MTTISPTDSADPLRDEWDAFADNLKVLGREALDSAPNDAERIDGLRFIATYPRIRASTDRHAGHPDLAI